MARSTAEDVKSILAPGKDYDGVSNLTPFLRAAASMIDRCVARAIREVRPYGLSDFADCEAWLAAHLYKMSDQALASKSTEGASGSYQGTTSDMGLKGTKYGQTALMLDPTGYLTGISTGARAGGFSNSLSYYTAPSFDERNGGG